MTRYYKDVYVSMTTMLPNGVHSMRPTVKMIEISKAQFDRLNVLNFKLEDCSKCRYPNKYTEKWIGGWAGTLEKVEDAFDSQTINWKQII